MSVHEETFHVIEKDGRFWGVQYADGRSTEYGFGPIAKADRVNPKYCLKPEDATYRGDKRGREELRKGRIVEVRITTTIEILEKRSK